MILQKIHEAILDIRLNQALLTSGILSRGKESYFDPLSDVGLHLTSMFKFEFTLAVAKTFASV